VFPLQVGGKQPLKGSRGFYAGSIALVQVRQWWRTTDYNIGIWTGGSDLVVIDLDVDKEDASSWARGGELPGISWWLKTCEIAEYDWEQTYCVVTASGGLHVYFSSEKPYPPAVGKFGALVDVRAGNSYVVAAGSQTDVGEFEHCCGDQVQPLPEWLAALLDPLPTPHVSPLEQLSRDSRNTFESSLSGLCRVLQDAGEGERNNTFNWVAWKIGQHWWSADEQDTAIDRVQSIGSAVGLTEKEMNDTLKAQRAKWPAR
jgi:uncharacterized protein YidB (DUF937 family)